MDRLVRATEWLLELGWRRNRPWYRVYIWAWFPSDNGQEQGVYQSALNTYAPYQFRPGIHR